MSAARALIDVTAKCGRATACDGQQDLKMCSMEPLTVVLDETGACGTGPSRPPPGAAESSISPVVTCLSAAASPEDWRSHASDARKDGDSGRSLSHRDGPAKSE